MRVRGRLIQVLIENYIKNNYLLTDLNKYLSDTLKFKVSVSYTSYETHYIVDITYRCDDDGNDYKLKLKLNKILSVGEITEE